MFILRLTLAILAALFLNTVILDAQWIQTNGPYGGMVNALATLEPAVFAGTDVGIFYSTDDGATWIETNYGLTNIDVRALAVSGSNIFAGTWGGGVFVSVDYGASWSEMNNGLSNKNISTLTTDGTNLYAGTWGDGVFVSTDKGASWTPTNSGLNDLSIRAFCVIGTNLFVGVTSGVFLSTDTGATWNPVISGLTNIDVRALASVDTNLFAGTYGGGIFLSTNNGTSWTPVNNGLTTSRIRSLSVSGSTILAGTWSNGIFVSTDNGAHWTQSNTGLTDLFVLSFTVRGPYIFAGTYSGGICASVDNGQTWIETNNGLSNCVILGLATNGVDIFAGANGGGVYHSDDNGQNWIKVNSGLTTHFIYALALSGSNLFAGTYANGVFLSTDNGISWNPVNNGLTDPYIYCLAVNGSNLFAGTHGGVYLSTDNGLNWNPINSGLTFTSIMCLAASGTNLFAGDFYNGVFFSQDTGKSWTPVNSGLTNLSVRGLAISGTNLFAGTFGGGVFRSSDSGTSWTPVDSGLTNNNITSLTFIGTNLFAGTYLGGIFLSTDQGTSWTPFNAGLTRMNCYALVSDGAYLFDASNGGVWRRPLLEMFPLPHIASNPTLWNYNTVSIGNNSDNIFTISNKGTADLNVTATAIIGTNASEFSIQSGGGLFTLAPGNTRDIVVRFIPTSDGSKSAVLSISSNDPDENPFLISLSGTGETPPSTRKRGDVNGNGVDPGDATSILRICVGLDPEPAPGTDAFYGADANADGTISPIDASWVLYYLVNDEYPNHTLPKVSVSSTIAFGKISVNTVENKGQVIDLPLVLTKSGGVISAYVDLHIDNSVADVKYVNAKLPEGSSMLYNYKNSALKIAIAGIHEMADGNIIHVGISLKEKEARLEVSGIAKLNDNPDIALENVSIREIPTSFAIQNNYPNPFNPTTTIKYQIPENAHVRLVVYNMLGQRLRTIVDQPQEAGYYSVQWDSKNDYGVSVTSGVYVYRISAMRDGQAGSFIAAKKMNLIK